jgi:hypothetical protein
VTAARARADDSWPALAPPGAAPHWAARLCVAVVVAAASGLLTSVWFRAARRPPDFWFPHAAARALVEGWNPYRVAVGSPRWPPSVPNFFPLPAAVIALPVAWASLPVAGGAFMAATGGALAWRLTREGLVRALVCCGGSYLMAARFGQWAPLLCLVALTPGAGWLAAAKPTIGLAMFAPRPTRRGILLAVAFGAGCMLVLPTWPLDWLRVLRGGDAYGLHLVPVATVWGWPVLLALARWRRPEARLLLALACVPQMPLFYDQVALGLVARSRIEIVAFTAVNFVTWVLWLNVLRDWTPASQLAALPYFVAGTYLPALLLVLLKSNDGETPPWIDRIQRRLADLGRARRRVG